MRRFSSRSAARLIVAPLLALGVLTAPVAAASAAPEAAPAVVVPGGNCSSLGIVGGPYFLTAVYRGGGKSYCGFTTQAAWLDATRDATARGIDQSSGYTSIYARDSTTAGTEVSVHFCATGTLCGARPSVVSAGSRQRGWQHGFTRCRSAGGYTQNVNGDEADSLYGFLYDVGSVRFGYGSRASIRSPYEITSTYSRSC